LEEWWRILILMYTSLHLKIGFNRVKSAGHHTASGWSLTTPAGNFIMSYGARRGIGWCYHIQTPDGTRTICDHAREKFFEIVQCPEDYQNRRWFSNCCNRKASALFVTIALNAPSNNSPGGVIRLTWDHYVWPPFRWYNLDLHLRYSISLLIIFFVLSYFKINIWRD